MYLYVTCIWHMPRRNLFLFFGFQNANRYHGNNKMHATHDSSIFRRFPLPWQLQVVDDSIACDGNFSYSSNGFSHLTWPQQLSKRVSLLNRTIYNAFYLHILIQMRSIGLIANVKTLHKKANDVEGTGSVLHSVYCLCMRPIEW